MKGSDSTASLFTEVGQALKSRLQRSISLPFSQYQTLWFVAEHTSPSMQDVARHFNIRAPSATFLVEELVQGGYLERHANAKDRRRVELTLTPKGKRAFKTFEAKRDAALSKLFGPLGDKDRTELNRILRKMLKRA
ncbi:MAG TPA: MarR family winged helix-turn-helix transcriptional regulator [Candidatus Paceibacterota bacterium]